ncbi:MAG TPA: hypothetical protein VEC99_12155, partial [Clostridia bacterium]|nr:hypothetical protein [Clostridia bacterium]
EDWHFNGNSLTFSLKGEPGATYVIETSSDLSKWSPVATNTLVEGSFQYTEPAPETPGVTRFYRAYRVP